MLNEVHWLKRNARAARLLRWVMPAAYAIVAVTLVVLGYSFYLLGSADGHLPPEQRQRVAELMSYLSWLALLALGLPFLAGLALRSMRHALGSDGVNLHVKLSGGGQVSLAPEQLVYDARTIGYRNKLFALGAGSWQSLYEAGEVDTYITPLLARATKLNALGMFRYQLKHREPLLIAALIYGAIVIGVVIATGMWRELLR